MYTITRPPEINQARLPTITVYEYSEVKKLDQMLEYQLAMSEQEPFKKKNAKDLLPFFGTLDIETTTIEAHTRYNNTGEHFAFPYLYQLYVFDHCWMFRTEEDFLSFMEYLGSLLSAHNYKYVMYVHNLSFEWQFLKKVLPVDYSKVFALQTRRIGKFSIYDGAIEFRCSYLLSNMSLEKFCENYNDELYRKDKELIDYEMVRFPWDILDSNILYYSAMDVICLHEAIYNIMCREGDTIKSIPMTNTGYVRRSCRDACLGPNTKHYRSDEEKKTYKKFKSYRRMFNKLAINLEQYDLLQRAFRGGNTHANRFKSGMIIPNVGSVDFSSSYPAELICSDYFPMGKLMKCTESVQTIADLEYYCKNYWVLIDAVFEDIELRYPSKVTCPYIPVSKMIREKDTEGHFRKGVFDNGRVMSQEGAFSFSFLGIEWDIIKKQYKGKIKVIKAYYTPKGYLPDALRNTAYEWFEKKTSLKNVAGFEYEYMKSKNRINSVYGMMVEKIIKDIISCNSAGEIIGRRPTDEEAQEQLDKFYTPMQLKFLQFQWGVTITALARVRHMELIDIVGDDFIYGDTDSVKFTNPDKYVFMIDEYNNTWKKYIAQCGCKYEAYTKDNEYQCLGIADFEGIYDEFVTLGAKKYADMKNGKLEITVAGVPKKVGAELLGDIRNFRQGFEFAVPDDSSLEKRQLWKKQLTYRDDTDFYLEVGDNKVHVSSCIAITRTTYLLDVTDDYKRLISANIYEEDDVWA